MSPATRRTIREDRLRELLAALIAAVQRRDSTRVAAVVEQIVLEYGEGEDA